MKKQREERRGEPVSIFSNTSIRLLPRVSHAKCQISKRQKMRCIQGGFQCSICLLDANPSDWRKCYIKLIFRIIVQQHFWRKCSFQGVPGRWGSKTKVPSVGKGGGGGRKLDIFWNYTMRYWTQCLRAPLLRLSPAPTRFSRNFSRSAFLAILKPGIGYKGNEIYIFTWLYRSQTQ